MNNSIEIINKSIGMCSGCGKYHKNMQFEALPAVITHRDMAFTHSGKTPCGHVLLLKDMEIDK